MGALLVAFAKQPSLQGNRALLRWGRFSVGYWAEGGDQRDSPELCGQSGAS